MASATAGTPPGLAVTYTGEEPDYLAAVAPLVDFVEVALDSFAETGGTGSVLRESALQTLATVSDRVRFIVHGTGLSIGSHEGCSEEYLRLLEQFLYSHDALWHSEHLGYTRVDGEFLGTMLALPKTKDVLEMICGRVASIQERLALPFLLENIVHILPDYPGDYTDAEFLNLLCERTGCGLILDVYNLECDVHNHGFDLDAFLADLDVSRVREIHVACGVEHKGFLVDVHSRRLRQSTVELARRVVGLAAGAVEVVTYELVPEAVPVLGHTAIREELVKLRTAIA